MNLKVSIALKLDLGTVIKTGNKVKKLGEIPMEFIEEDLSRIINERLGSGIELTMFKIVELER